MKRILEILEQPEEIASPEDGVVLSRFQGADRI